VFTHAHADHIFGLDDIRRFNEIQGTEIPCYGHRRTVEAVSQAFEYIFRPTQAGGGKPRLRLRLGKSSRFVSTALSYSSP